MMLLPFCKKKRGLKNVFHIMYVIPIISPKPIMFPFVLFDTVTSLLILF